MNIPENTHPEDEANKQLNKDNLLAIWKAILKEMNEIIGHNKSNYSPIGVTHLVPLLEKEVSDPDNKGYYAVMDELSPVNAAIMDLNTFFDVEVKKVLPNYEVARLLVNKTIPDKVERDLHVLQWLNKELFIQSLPTDSFVPDGFDIAQYYYKELILANDLLDKIQMCSQGVFTRYDPMGVVQYRDFLLNEINTNRLLESNARDKHVPFLETAKADVAIFFEKIVAFRYPNYTILLKTIEEPDYLREHSEVLTKLLAAIGDMVPTQPTGYRPQPQPNTGRGCSGMNTNTY